MDNSRYPFPRGMAKLYEFTEPVIRAAAPRGGRALDVGCGDGSVAGFLMREGVTKVVGFDISEYAVEAAGSINPGPQYLVGNAEDHSFLRGLGRFDLVLVRNTFHHFSDKEGFLRATPELLNDGGKFLLIDLDWESNFALLGALATHARYAMRHTPVNTFNLLARTRMFLGRSMREHRRRDRELLRDQGWLTAADVRTKLRRALPAAAYSRVGSFLGYGGAYVTSFVKEVA